MSFPDESPLVLDTVVLLYFTLVDRLELLVDLAPKGLVTTAIVFDPDAGTLCEIGRARHFYEKMSIDPRASLDKQQKSQLAIARFDGVSSLYDEGRLTVVELTDSEVDLFSMLATRRTAQAAGIQREIDPGEASCLAVAIERSWILATDDTDALRVLEVIASGHRYERIRKLLIRAAKNGHISRITANEIHAEMRKWGFWDHTEPFSAVQPADQTGSSGCSP